MKIGVLCAGDREAAPVLSMMAVERVSKKAMLRVVEGRLGGMEAAALFSGVCKVNAAIAAQVLIDTYGCDAVINVGTAGEMCAELRILDTVVAEEAAYYDVDKEILTEFHPWMETVYFRSDADLLQKARAAFGCLNREQRIVFGRMVTGEQFIRDERRDEINARFAPQSVDMETAAIAHVCHVNGVPFLAIRTITDTADHSGVEAFDKNCDRAAKISADLLSVLMEELARA